MGKSKGKRVSQTTGARWGVDASVNHRPVRFTDRKKQADKRACRNRKDWN